MDKSKVLSVVSYLTWIGWIVALVLRDGGDQLVRRHLNQELVLNIITTVGSIITRFGMVGSVIGWVINVVTLVLAVLGIIRAVKGSSEPLPLIGSINIL